MRNGEATTRHVIPLHRRFAPLLSPLKGGLNGEALLAASAPQSPVLPSGGANRPPGHLIPCIVASLLCCPP
jgi:hypothetical protein